MGEEGEHFAPLDGLDVDVAAPADGAAAVDEGVGGGGRPVDFEDDGVVAHPSEPVLGVAIIPFPPVDNGVPVVSGAVVFVLLGDDMGAVDVVVEDMEGGFDEIGFVGSVDGGCQFRSIDGWGKKRHWLVARNEPFSNVGWHGGLHSRKDVVAILFLLCRGHHPWQNWVYSVGGRGQDAVWQTRY